VFKLGTNSIGFEVKEREFGKQDRGISPKGANDQTSFITARLLLGNPQRFQCFEIFFAKEIIFCEDAIFTLTGAHYQEMFLNGKKVDHACVYEVAKGDVLKLGKRLKGFRSYLMAAKIDRARIGKKSKGYTHYFSHKTDAIRVTQGPESVYLKEDFFKHAYKISTKSDMSGLRLEKKLKAHRYDIITSAVTDGTIQLTRDGPIVLMRHRQSTGGYPRVLNIIEADMDRLAQYPHGTLVRFELTTIAMSIELLLEHEKTLRKIEEDLLG
jgi:allophanate hydrolase subunit 2